MKEAEQLIKIAKSLISGQMIPFRQVKVKVFKLSQKIRDPLDYHEFEKGFVGDLGLYKDRFFFKSHNDVTDASFDKAILKGDDLWLTGRDGTFAFNLSGVSNMSPITLDMLKEDIVKLRPKGLKIAASKTKAAYEKIVKSLKRTKWPLTVTYNDEYGTIEVLTGNYAPRKLINDVNKAVNRVDKDIRVDVVGSSSEYDHNQYDGSSYVNGGHKEVWE